MGTLLDTSADFSNLSLSLAGKALEVGIFFPLTELSHRQVKANTKNDISVSLTYVFRTLN